MLKKILTRLAFASVLSVSAPVSHATTITQNFAGDPLTNGWSVFGDASLLAWDSTNQNLRVTWDSTKTNSFFHHPLGDNLTRNDDFQIEFDLTLDDCISGTEPGKTGPLQIGIGLFDPTTVTNVDFGRGKYGWASNIVEFNYFPYGYYVFGPDTYPSAPTTTADFVSSSAYSIAPTAFNPYYVFELPASQPVHVTMKYTARNQSLDLTLTTNNVVLYHPGNVVLNSPFSTFSSSDDYLVNTFSVSSYSSFGDYYNSVLGHGIVDNLFIHIPPVQDFTGAFSNTVWQTQFRSRSNWLYTLERTVDLSAWTNVSTTVSGNATNLFLQDPNPPTGQAFYRVRAESP